ncbi:hypothetical protein P175DRAFT_060932 [Aspergillus ochraceoroseus IBT 24754]|uniref:Uncharacterized protein n=1 Tax=Aspergillus ochraceoroseus IBT 24754 TaxID=1392256 RepID=A0A2T5M972_9EURO|nr:uncharacterized protein P175DRAFT_060932 [Aspergillus ochraceoroseus IBT 24754]PTU25064.1 hypothetical protein P175DRAFT_060932 [Aspergillus ochraceoroseus IBT 24754]
MKTKNVNSHLRDIITQCCLGFVSAVFFRVAIHSVSMVRNNPRLKEVHIQPDTRPIMGREISSWVVVSC